SPQNVSPDYIQQVTTEQSQPAELPDKPLFPEARPQPPGATLSERLKNAISVYDFVGRYVDLDERATGFCPVHDDQRRSFGVNREEWFWSCWEGCGGGSLIDFWMKWRQRERLDASFTATLKALADILLPR